MVVVLLQNQSNDMYMMRYTYYYNIAICPVICHQISYQDSCDTRCYFMDITSCRDDLGNSSTGPWPVYASVTSLRVDRFSEKSRLRTTARLISHAHTHIHTCNLYKVRARLFARARHNTHVILLHDDTRVLYYT
uniref:Uncharacterized protein n=1 Tax=Schizaphis graminum TaxID=13262 RepID=A0A2S2NTC9_SCHGA